MSPKVKRFLATWSPVVATGAFAAWESVRLHAYDVPFSLLLACGLALWSSLLVLCSRIAEAAKTTTHRCAAPDCGFTVRLRRTSPVENRRWQEMAAAHPEHRL
ncbi:hypothetical protein [Streptomyces sp. WMMB 322]|uniref:hypothetical protein n=1 Tax=Streptomyces sp. WMMB 322 TaxID=1286821 RepID=UPI0006E44BA8|nr:hypothetical protein [Streptomyces sp. WMMB 322]SCK47236.1 hypothetical protein H180DRAFT_04214 [Streptomyces sp. WMMB 322]